MAKLAHCTSVPEYVAVRVVSVGPVVLFWVNLEPNEEYSVHVAAVVEASWHDMIAVLLVCQYICSRCGRSQMWVKRIAGWGFQIY